MTLVVSFHVFPKEVENMLVEKVYVSLILRLNLDKIT